MSTISEYCIPNFIYQLIDNSGLPAAGALIYTYESGTTVNKSTYADAFGASELTNPVVLDAYGRRSIFGDGVYSIKVTAADGTTIVDKIDGIVFSATSGSADSAVSVLPNYSAVRALTSTPSQIYVQGRNTAGDGGQGLFALVPSGYDDDGSILTCNSGANFYKRIYDKYLDAQWYGVIYGSANDQYQYLLSAANASVSTGDPVYINGEVTIAQNLTVQNGAAIEFGDSGSIVGSSAAIFKFESGSHFVGSKRCIGANITLELVAGVAESINPNWWIGSDNYKLAQAANCTKPDSLSIPAITGTGWSNNTNILHAPGNTVYGNLAIAGYEAGDRYKLSLDITRNSQVEYAMSNNVVSTNWTGSFATGYHHSNGSGTTSLTIATTVPALSATLGFAVANITSGSVTVMLGSAVIGTYSVGATVSQSITPAANAGLIFTPTNDFVGDLLGISLTVSASLINQAVNDMALTEVGWTGNKDAFTHTVGNTTAALLTKATPISAKSVITGSFDLVRNATESNILTDSMITLSEFSGSVATGWNPSISNPGPGNAITGTFSADPTTTYKITITASGITQGLTVFNPVNIGPQSTRITQNGTTEIIGHLNTTNNIKIYLYMYQTNPQGINIKLSIVPVNPGNVTITADGNALIMNSDPTKTVKDTGHYTFTYSPSTAASVVSFAPTTDFDGTISNFSYIVNNPGKVAVYAGQQYLGDVVAGNYSFIFNASTIYPYIQLQPTIDFYGSISGLAIDGISSLIPIKLTDAYSISADIALGTLDPWGGSINVTAASAVSVDWLVNNRAEQWISYNNIAYIKSVSIADIAYPEHCGATGNGTSDDSIGIKYALSNSSALLTSNYIVKTAFALTNDCEISGTAASITVDNVIVSLGNIVDNGVSISTANTAAISFTSLDIISATITTNYSSTFTANTFNASLVTANLAAPIINTNGAVIDRSTFTSTSTLNNPIKAISVVSALTNSTLNGFTGFTATNNAKISDSAFVSSNGYGFDIGTNVTVYATNIKAAVSILAIFADSTGALVAKNITNCDDAVSSSAALGDRSLYTNLLSNAIGTVIESETNILDTTVGNVKTMRTVLNNKATSGKTFSSLYIDYDYCLANGGEWQTGFTANDASLVTGGFKILGANDDNVHTAQCRPLPGSSNTIVGRWQTQLMFGGIMELTITAPNTGFAKGAGLSFAYRYNKTNSQTSTSTIDTLFNKVIDLPVTSSATTMKIKIPYWGGLHPFNLVGGRSYVYIDTILNAWFDVKYKNLNNCIFDITYHPLLPANGSVVNWYNSPRDITQWVLVDTVDPYFIWNDPDPRKVNMPGSLIVRATNSFNLDTMLSTTYNFMLLNFDYFIDVEANCLGATSYLFALKFQPTDNVLYYYKCDNWHLDNRGDTLFMYGSRFSS